jgi:hypothetical protein
MDGRVKPLQAFQHHVALGANPIVILRLVSCRFVPSDLKAQLVKFLIVLFKEIQNPPSVPLPVSIFHRHFCPANISVEVTLSV